MQSHGLACLSLLSSDGCTVVGFFFFFFFLCVWALSTGFWWIVAMVSCKKREGRGILVLCVMCKTRC